MMNMSGQGNTPSLLWLLQNAKDQELSSYAWQTWAEFMWTHLPAIQSLVCYVTPVLCTLGILGNILSAVTWLRRSMHDTNSSAIYLGTLALTDMSFLVLNLMQSAHWDWDRHVLDKPWLCEGFHVLYYFTQYMSPLLVLAFTVERWIAICKPHHKTKLCTVSRSLKVTVTFLICTMLLSSLHAHTWIYDHLEEVCTTRSAMVEGGPTSLFNIWRWTTELVIFCAIPIGVLIFNVLVLSEIYKMSKKCEAFASSMTKALSASSPTSTAMLLSVSFLYIFTTVPYTLIDIMRVNFPEGDKTISDEDLAQDPTWHRFLAFESAKQIVRIFYLMNFSLNFIIYMITGVKFRKLLFDLFHCPFRDRTIHPDETHVKDLGQG